MSLRYSPEELLMRGQFDHEQSSQSRSIAGIKLVWCECDGGNDSTCHYWAILTVITVN